METLGEFKRRIKKVNQPREYKVRNSLGVYDGYKYYRKNKIKKDKYPMIIRCNSIFQESFKTR